MSASELLLLVRPDLSRSRSGLREFKKRYTKESLLLGDLFDLCATIADAGGAHSKQIGALREYLKGLWQGTARQLDLFTASSYQAILHDPDPTKLYRDLNERVRVVRDALKAFTHGYMPLTLIQRLFPAQEKRHPDILTLLMRGFDPQLDEKDCSVFERQVRFEAQRTAILALVNHEQLRRWRKIGYKRTREDFRAVSEGLQRRQIIGTQNSAYKRRLTRSWHNPADNYRTVWIEGISGQEPTHTGKLTEKRTYLVHAVLRHPDGPLPILLQVRRKGLWQTLGKLRSLPPLTPDKIALIADRYGICFAYRNLEELRKGSDWLRGELTFNPRLGSHWEKYKDATEQPVNPYSARNFVAISYYRMLLGRRYHIQNRLALQHVDLIRSHGDENHTLYHLRQYTASGGLFPWLFPYELYGIDWSYSPVIAKMKEHVIASLPK